MRQDVKKLIEKLQDWPDGVLHTNPDGTEVISIYIEDFLLYPQCSGMIHSYLYFGQETENGICEMKNAAQNIFAVNGNGPYEPTKNPYRVIEHYEKQYKLSYQDVIQSDQTHIPAKIYVEPSKDDSCVVYCSYYDQGYPHNYRDQAHMTVEHHEEIFFASKIDGANVNPQINAKRIQDSASWLLNHDAITKLDLAPKRAITKFIPGKEPVL